MAMTAARRHEGQHPDQPGRGTIAPELDILGYTLFAVVAFATVWILVRRVGL